MLTTDLSPTCWHGRQTSFAGTLSSFKFLDTCLTSFMFAGIMLHTTINSFLSEELEIMPMRWVCIKSIKLREEFASSFSPKASSSCSAAPFTCGLPLAPDNMRFLVTTESSSSAKGRFRDSMGTVKSQLWWKGNPLRGDTTGPSVHDSNSGWTNYQIL